MFEKETIASQLNAVVKHYWPSPYAWPLAGMASMVLVIMATISYSLYSWWYALPELVLATAPLVWITVYLSSRRNKVCATCPEA